MPALTARQIRYLFLCLFGSQAEEAAALISADHLAKQATRLRLPDGGLDFEALKLDMVAQALARTRNAKEAAALLHMSPRMVSYYKAKLTAVPLLLLFLFPAVATAQEPPARTRFNLALGASIVAGGADLGTSTYRLGQGGFTELNPLLKPFEDQPALFGTLKTSLHVGLAFFYHWLYARHPRAAEISAWTSAAVFSGLAIRNARLDRLDQKGR